MIQTLATQELVRWTQTSTAPTAEILLAIAPPATLLEIAVSCRAMTTAKTAFSLGAVPLAPVVRKASMSTSVTALVLPTAHSAFAQTLLGFVPITTCA